MSRRPVIGILGKGPGWKPDPQVATEFDFRTIVEVNADNWRSIAGQHQAVLIPLDGHRVDDAFIEGLNWRMLVQATKVGMWSLDSHHDGWHDLEARVAADQDVFFTAHSEWCSKIGPNAVWVPCGCPALSPTGPRGKLAISPDLVMAYVPYQSERTLTVYEMHCLLRNWEITYIFGSVPRTLLAPFYASGKAVLNVNQNTDLNLRQFEGLGVGRPVVMMPAHDWGHSRFDSLRPFTVEISRSPTLDQVRAAVEKIATMDARPAAEEVRARHTTMHRYIEMAEMLLSR